MPFNPYNTATGPSQAWGGDPNWIRTSGASWMPSQAPPPPVRTTTTTTGPNGGGAGSGGGINYGAGITSAPPTPDRIGAPSQVGREGDIGMSPSATSLGQLDDAGRAAQAAVFGRAKGRAGQIASSALSGLRSALASRGVLGSGMETQGTVDAAMQGANILADTNREEAIQESQRGERAREFQTQAQLQQRGQNITQRGQDMGQILGVRGQDITQRGQDFTGRGQDISLMGLQNAAGGSTTTTTQSESVPGWNGYTNYNVKPVRLY